MNPIDYKNNTLFIEMPSKDLADIKAILTDINNINIEIIDGVTPHNHPEITPERFADLKQQLGKVRLDLANRQNDQVTIGLKETSLIDLSIILSATYSTDEPFVGEGQVAVTDEDIERIEEQVTLISYGLKSIEQIERLEKELNISIPRFKYAQKQD